MLFGGGSFVCYDEDIFILMGFVDRDEVIFGLEAVCFCLP